MGQQEKLEQFRRRKREWERFGIDDDFHQGLCDPCHLEPADDPTECTVSNALKASVVEAVDNYFDIGKSQFKMRDDENGRGDEHPTVYAIDDKPALHRQRLEDTLDSARALREQLADLPDKTVERLCGYGFETEYPPDPDGLAAETLDRRYRKQLEARELIESDGVEEDEKTNAWQDFLSVSHDIPGEFDELGEWMDRLILACKSTLERLPNDPRLTKRGERKLAWTANKIFHIYLAYSLSGMSPQDHQEITRGPSYDELDSDGAPDLEERSIWSVRPVEYCEDRDEFIRAVLELAGIDPPSSKSGLAKWRDGSVLDDLPWGGTPLTKALGMLQYWFRDDRELSIGTAKILRESMLDAMKAVAEATEIPADTCTPDGGAVFSALTRTNRYDHPPLQTPHEF